MKDRKKNAAISPAIQNSQMDVPVEQSTDKEGIFKNLFMDMAYKSLSSKYPYLVEHIKDFKCLNSDVEKGYAVGAFILQLPTSQDIFTIPVVLESNSLQPIMFIHSQEMDTFLPLTEEWISEIMKRTEENVGSLATPKLERLQENNNISDINPLPSYGNLIGSLGKVGSLRIDIPEIIKNLPNDSKEKFFNFLENNKKIASEFFGRYPKDKILESFKKTAQEEATPEKDIVVATARTPLDMVKKEFSKDHVVMENIATKGYALKDERPTKNQLVVFTDYLNELENPTESGVYEIYLSTGKMSPALIIQDPIILGYQGELCSRIRKMDDSIHETGYKSYSVKAKNKCLVLFPDGNFKIMKNDNIMATPTLAEAMSDSNIYKHVYGDKSSEIPLNKPFLFIKKTGNGYISTGPIVVASKMTEDGDVKCTTAYGENSIIYTDKYPAKNLYVTKNNTVIVPSSFKVVPLEKEVNEDVILGSMKTILTLMNYRLLEKGGKPLTIVRDDKSSYGVETARPVRRVDAVLKIAKEYDVNALQVDKLLDEMDKLGTRVITTYVLPKEEKIAQDIDPMMLQQMMAQQQMGQPQMGQPSPEMMQQMTAQQQMGQPSPEMMQQMMAQQQMGQPSPEMMGQPSPEMMGQPSPEMMGQIPPELMQAGADVSGALGGQDMYDLSALMSLSYISKIEEIFPKYVPSLMTAMDDLARILLNFWMNAKEIQEDIGISEYTNLELKIKTIFTNLSNLMLDLNKKVDVFQK